MRRKSRRIARVQMLNIGKQKISIESIKAMEAYKALVTCYTKDEMEIFLKNEGLLLKERVF